eukprot:11279364-Ditylum_brightwellii.AAC.1
MDKRVDKSSDGERNYLPMYLCCECEEYLKKGDSDSASYWAGMLWKILLSELVLKAEEFAETLWFYMQLRWRVWWKQELDMLFFRPRHGRKQSVVYPYTSFDIEGIDMMFDVTEKLE